MTTSPAPPVADSEPPRPRVRPAVLIAAAALTVGFALLPFVLYDAGAGLGYYPWNFSPILPLGLYAAAFLRNRALAAALPVVVWIVSGFALWAYTGEAAMGFPKVIVWVWAGLAAAAGLGFVLRRNRSWAAVGGTGLGAGALFFLVSNFGVWAGGEYGYGFDGLLNCYAAAVPFFRGTLLSLVVFLPALFAPAAVRFPAAIRRDAGAAA